MKCYKSLSRGVFQGIQPTNPNIRSPRDEPNRACENPEPKKPPPCIHFAAQLLVIVAALNEVWISFAKLENSSRVGMT